VEIISAGNGAGDEYKVKTGIAAPHVAGAVALYLNSHPGAGFEVLEALKVSCQGKSQSCPARNCGVENDYWPHMAYGYG
jgi:hypothetical protein